MFVNVLLLRYGSGNTERLLEVEDTVSTGLYGRYEGYLVVSDTNSAAEAVARAEAMLATAATEQRDITAGVIPANDHDYPYIAYVLGNSVTVPDENDDPQQERVLSIAIAEDDNSGVAAITLGLRGVVLRTSERIGRNVGRDQLGSRDVLGEVARRGR